MLGDDATKLLKELNRFVGLFPSYNYEAVQSIQKETNILFEQATEYMNNTKELENHRHFLEVARLIIQRNKRVLLVYHNHRLEKIKELVWKTRAEGAGRKPAPKEIRDNLSKEELEFFKHYASLVHNYKLNFIDCLDVTSSDIPPKSVYIHVRAKKDIQIELEDGERLSFRRGEQDYVKRSHVEKLIEQGHLIHVLK